MEKQPRRKLDFDDKDLGIVAIVVLGVAGMLVMAGAQKDPSLAVTGAITAVAGLATGRKPARANGEPVVTTETNNESQGVS